MLLIVKVRCSLITKIRVDKIEATDDLEKEVLRIKV